VIIYIGLNRAQAQAQAQAHPEFFSGWADPEVRCNLCLTLYTMF